MNPENERTLLAIWNDVWHLFGGSLAIAQCQGSVDRIRYEVEHRLARSMQMAMVGALRADGFSRIDRHMLMRWLDSGRVGEIMCICRYEERSTRGLDTWQIRADVRCPPLTEFRVYPYMIYQEDRREPYHNRNRPGIALVPDQEVRRRREAMARELFSESNARHMFVDDPYVDDPPRRSDDRVDAATYAWTSIAQRTRDAVQTSQIVGRVNITVQELARRLGVDLGAPQAAIVEARVRDAMRGVGGVSASTINQTVARFHATIAEVQRSQSPDTAIGPELEQLARLTAPIGTDTEGIRGILNEGQPIGDQLSWRDPRAGDPLTASVGPSYVNFMNEVARRAGMSAMPGALARWLRSRLGDAQMSAYVARCREVSEVRGGWRTVVGAAIDAPDDYLTAERCVELKKSKCTGKRCKKKVDNPSGMCEKCARVWGAIDSLVRVARGIANAIAMRLAASLAGPHMTTLDHCWVELAVMNHPTWGHRRTFGKPYCVLHGPTMGTAHNTATGSTVRTDVHCSACYPDYVERLRFLEDARHAVDIVLYRLCLVAGYFLWQSTDDLTKRTCMIAHELDLERTLIPSTTFEPELYCRPLELGEPEPDARQKFKDLVWKVITGFDRIPQDTAVEMVAHGMCVALSHTYPEGAPHHAVVSLVGDKIHVGWMTHQVVFPDDYNAQPPTNAVIDEKHGVRELLLEMT